MFKFIGSYQYGDIIFFIVIIGLIIDIIIHLVKQMKNSGKWKVNYSNFAGYIIGSMLLMSYLTRALRNNIGIPMLISMWLAVLCYSILRNFNKR